MPVKIVSRDRGKDYARVVSRAAPQALQVVDRFHLVRNLSEVHEMLLAHCRAEIRQPDADQLLPSQEAEKLGRPLPTPAAWQQRTPSPIEIAHQARQASRDDRFRQMTALRAHGLTQAAVAKRMGMSERAVRNWLKRGAAPSWKRQFRRCSVFDPYAAYVLERWQEGVHEAKQLYEEIRGQGFPGTVRIVQRFVQALVDEPKAITLPPTTAAEGFSANNATWLFIRDPKQLMPENQAELELICQCSQTARKTYELTQQFMTMLALASRSGF
jgi:transposase